jgi:subtilase family serine protease
VWASSWSVWRILPLCALVLVLPALAASQPNLQPTGITFDTSTAVVGGTVFFDSGVSNTGDVDTGIFNVKWFVNGQEVGAYGSHAGVPAGQTALDGNSQFSWTFDSPGTHSVTFTVDVDNHVLESNEGDNSGSVQVTVTGGRLVLGSHPLSPSSATIPSFLRKDVPLSALAPPRPM